MALTKTEKILTILQREAELTVALLDVALSSRPSLYAKLRKLADDGLTPFKSDWVDVLRERRKITKILSLLKRDGFITSEKSGTGALWSIARKGLDKLSSATRREKLREKMPSPNTIIVSYDIPEKFRRERPRLREILRALEYKMVHKSVWIGRHRIPQPCIDEWRQKKILPFLHIFEVGRRGTLTRLFEKKVV